MHAKTVRDMLARSLEAYAADGGEHSGDYWCGWFKTTLEDALRALDGGAE